MWGTSGICIGTSIIQYIYINDICYQFMNTHICNFAADDTTLSACSINLEELVHNLEYDALSAIIWFDNNYMKLSI